MNFEIGKIYTHFSYGKCKLISIEGDDLFFEGQPGAILVLNKTPSKARAKGWEQITLEEQFIISNDRDAE